MFIVNRKTDIRVRLSIFLSFLIFNLHCDNFQKTKEDCTPYTCEMLLTSLLCNGFIIFEVRVVLTICLIILTAVYGIIKPLPVSMSMR